jgi:hypothetical protein
LQHVNNHAINGIGSIVASQSFYCRNVSFSSLRSNKKNRIKSRQPQNQNRIKSWALTIEPNIIDLNVNREKWRGATSLEIGILGWRLFEHFFGQIT